MPFAGKTEELAKKAKVPDAVQAWLAGTGVVDYTDIAMMAASEVEVTPTIIDVLLAVGIKPVEHVYGKIALKKFWMARRGLYEADRRPEKDNSVVIDANIPSADDLDIATKWQARLNFLLPDAQLRIQMHPPQITVWLAETLRTRSCVNKACRNGRGHLGRHRVGVRALHTHSCVLHDIVIHLNV